MNDNLQRFFLVIHKQNLSIEMPEHHYGVFATGETIRFEVNASEETPVYYGLGVPLQDIPEADFEFLSRTVLR